MLTKERILEWNAGGLLADVLGFETDEVALKALASDVETFTGKHFIDFTGGIAVHACGHNHPEIVAEIQKQAGLFLHTSDILKHAPQLELAALLQEKLQLSAPETEWSFLFLNGGSESIDAAAKFALKATGRKKFVALNGAFHGRTIFATTLSHSKKAHWEPYEQFLAPLRANVIHAPAPRCQRCAVKKEPNCCVDGIERIFEEHGKEIAAIFVEPQQGEGGYFPITASAAARIREITNRHGALFIADEIQSGIGRTGKWFGYQHWNVTPDVVVFGKAVGGGLPLAGFAAPKELLAKWQPGEHGTTFGGNPLSCAAGVQALKIIEREGLVEYTACLGEKVKARFGALIGHYGIADVRGNGLMLGIELRDANGNPDYARCERVKAACREKGLLLLTCGAKIGDPAVDNSAIRLIPALNIPEATLTFGLNIFETALRETE